MTAITLKLPARYATVRPGPLGGVEVLIDHLTLSSLADALNAMEHNDTDPGERRMNADQCQDALLREVLHSWTPAELVEAKIPAVLELAEQIATLTRERDEARAVLRDAWPFFEEDDGGFATPKYQAVIDRVRPYGATTTPGAQA